LFDSVVILLLVCIDFCMQKSIHTKRRITTESNNNFAVFSTGTELVLTTVLCAW